MAWHRELGTVMAEDIIVDSGTYAYRTFVNGEYTWHEDIALDRESVEWQTGAVAIDDASGEHKPTDPLYQNPLIRGARDAATYAWGLKHTTDAVELIFIDTNTGKIVDAHTDRTLRGSDDPARYIKSLFMEKDRKNQHVHVMTWGDDSLAKALSGVEGVDSVWVNSTRHTGQSFTQGASGTTPSDTRTPAEKKTDAILNRAWSG